MPLSIKELCDTRRMLVDQNRAALDRAEAEDRGLNSEEKAEYDKRDTEIDKLTEQINQLTDNENKKQRLRQLDEELSRPLPRQTVPVKPGQSPPREAGDESSRIIDFGRLGKLTFRPQDSLWHRCTYEYERAFIGYLNFDYTKSHAEQLGLKISDDTRGGYLAPVSFLSRVIKFLDDAVLIRQLANVLPPTTAKSVGAVSYDTDPGDADWTPEVPASALSEDDGMRYGSRELTPHLLTKLVKSSMKMIRSMPGIEDFIAQRLAYVFGVTEEKAFLTGSGGQRPLGVFTASSQGISTARDTVCASATAFTADELIDCIHALKDTYKMRSTWVVSREFRKRARKLKDGSGQYLWQPGLGGTPDTLLERPMRVSEFAPSTFTTGLYVAIVGDFSNYWIQDSMDLELQRLDELFAATNQIGWIGRKETDGMPVLEEAFSRLRLG